MNQVLRVVDKFVLGFSMSALPPGEKMWEYDDTQFEQVRWRKYEEGREVWPSVGVQPYLGLDCLHGELPPLRVLVLI